MPRQQLAEAKVTRKFQITLPSRVREVLGDVLPGDYILFARDGGRIIIEVGTLKPKGPKQQ
jgi:AbrB family looped-hinge helix DNA binding protein